MGLIIDRHITVRILCQIKSVLSGSCHPVRAICCTAFFGLFRLEELLLDTPKYFHSTINLAWDDTALDNPVTLWIIYIILRNQLGTGSDIVVGHTDMELCPVSAILSYISIRGPRGAHINFHL